MTNKITYNSDREKNFKNIRFCVSNQILLEALGQYEIDNCAEASDLVKDLLIEELEEEGYIELEIQ